MADSKGSAMAFRHLTRNS